MTLWNEDDVALRPEYEREIDRHILKEVQSGVRDLWELIGALPAVYPTVVRDSVKRLVAGSKIPEYVLKEGTAFGPKSAVNKAIAGLPLPHPLDFDWRFTTDCAAELLDRLITLTRTADVIGLLGAPSVYLLAAERNTARQFFLLDQNRALKGISSRRFRRESAHLSDVLTGDEDPPMSHVVLADPPWYPIEALGFLRAASRICVANGSVLLSFPPVGVRPTIPHERNRIIREAKTNGLELTRIENLALSYVTPFFEHNALRAAGFANTSPSWRRGDLMVFRKQPGVTPAFKAQKNSTIRWVDCDLNGIKFKIRPKEKQNSLDPRLKTLVPGDVLPTVSRRDARRNGVAVWTSGNRVYDCDAPNIFATLMKALAAPTDPIEAVRGNMSFQINEKHIADLEATKSQILRIVEIERQELAEVEGGR